jgi:hypothetical protein
MSAGAPFVLRQDVSFLSERVTLCGVRRDGTKIPGCNGEFNRGYLVHPGFGVMFLIMQEPASAPSPPMAPAGPGAAA